MLMEVRTLPRGRPKSAPRSRSLDRGSELDLSHTLTVSEIRAQCQGQTQGRTLDRRTARTRGQSVERGYHEDSNGNYGNSKSPETLQEALAMFRDTLQQSRRGPSPPQTKIPNKPITSQPVSVKPVSSKPTSAKPDIIPDSCGKTMHAYDNGTYGIIGGSNIGNNTSNTNLGVSSMSPQPSNTPEKLSPSSSHNQPCLLDQFLERKRNSCAYRSLPRLKLGLRDAPLAIDNQSGAERSFSQSMSVCSSPASTPRGIIKSLPGVISSGTRPYVTANSSPVHTGSKLSNTGIKTPEKSPLTPNAIPRSFHPSANTQSYSHSHSTATTPDSPSLSFGTFRKCNSVPSSPSVEAARLPPRPPVKPKPSAYVMPSPRVTPRNQGMGALSRKPPPSPATKPKAEQSSVERPKAEFSKLERPKTKDLDDMPIDDAYMVCISSN